MKKKVLCSFVEKNELHFQSAVTRLIELLKIE